MRDNTHLVMHNTVRTMQDAQDKTNIKINYHCGKVGRLLRVKS